MNLPATGSISITLKELFTKTRVNFRPDLTEDTFRLNGRKAGETETRRVGNFLDLIRKLSGQALFADVVSENNYPTGAGLASSASGFAALSLAACSALNLKLSPSRLSVVARQGSGSAARSIFGGFVEMKAGERPDGSDAVAVQIAAEDHFPIEVLVAITTREAKKIGSTEGMELTKKTSPYYPAWVQSCRSDLEEMRKAILQRDFRKLGEISENSSLKMHALIMSTKPAILYWNPTTIEIIHTVWEMRKNGIEAYVSIDAGPQVKILSLPENSWRVWDNIINIRGVERVIQTGLGPGARLTGAESNES
ncbi:MAG: diphosphomevalonate decarboxylase [Calditrichia bacterium]